MAVVNWDPGYNKTLTIASGQTESGDTINLAGLGARRKMGITIINPATLPETVNVHVAESSSGTFQPLYSGGTAIALDADGATVITDVIAGALKLVATGAVAANRTFILQGNADR